MYQFLTGWSIHSESKNFLVIEHQQRHKTLSVDDVEVIDTWASNQGLELCHISISFPDPPQILLRKVI